MAIQGACFKTALIISGTFAREIITVKEHSADLEHRRPHVEELNCRSCLIENENESICITYGANIRAGWNWDQEWYDDPDTVDVKDGFYKLALDIYSQQSGGFSSLVDINKLYYSNVMMTVENFKSLLSMELYYFYESRRTCLFAYTTVDDFSIIATVSMRFIQCYKDVISTLWTLENWTSIYAKWLDECDLSTPETITPISWDLDSTSYSFDLIGTKRANEKLSEDIDNTECFPGFIWTGSPFGDYLGEIQDNFVTYLYHRLQ